LIELTLLSRVAWRGTEITGARQRTLLVLLAADLRSGCSAGRLIDELWPGEPPEHPAKALQTLVSRARARLGAGVIESTPAGYRLTLDPEQVDSSAVVLRRREAERCARAGDHAAALTAAEKGLALFGPEGGAVRDGPGGGARFGLDDEARVGPDDGAGFFRPDGGAAHFGPDGGLGEGVRRALVRIRALALARLDRAADAVGPLTTLNAEHPRDEEILLELLRCEAATAGAGAALVRYETYRRALRDGLGADPGPPLRALHRELLLDDAPSVRRGLRHEPNELLGRDADLERVGALLRTSRVVSIVGAGGLGKTRLAQAVGRQARQRLVCLVELAGVTGDVQGEVASSLGVTGVDGIAEVLGTGLLVLDNCEHVIDEAAELVAALVARGPALRVLTTSRAPLGLSSESVYPLPELDLATSVALFVQRARAARPAGIPPGVAREICRQLDGLPLAVELAAARTRTMSPTEIAQRLHDRLALLRGGHRDAPERHRTLHAVIEWSWNLLEPPAREAMRGLSIFPGGFDAAAARFFTDDTVVEQLVGQSLLKVVDSEAGTRFRMLETVREFSREEAPGANEDRFLAWARSRAGLADGDLTRAVGKIRPDEDNLMLALRHGLERRDAPTVAATAALLGTLWLVDSKLTRLTALSTDVPSVLADFRPAGPMAEATRTGIIVCTLMAFLLRRPEPPATRAVLGRLPPPDPRTVVGAAQIAMAAADEKALLVLCDSDLPVLATIACYGHSYLAEHSDDPVTALRSARRMLPAAPDPWLRALAHSRIGELCLQADPGEEAFRHIDAALSIMEELGAHSSSVRARWALVLANLQRGALDQAEQGLEQLAGGVVAEDAGPKLMEICTRAEIRLGRGDVDGGLALWRRAADGLADETDPWSVEVRAVAVLAHCRHGRLDLVTRVAGTLPATLSRVLSGPPAGGSGRICGVLLIALAAVLDRHGATAPAVRAVALAERFGFSSTFQDPARFAEAARGLDRSCYAAARAELATSDEEGLRAVARKLAAAWDGVDGVDGVDPLDRSVAGRWGTAVSDGDRGRTAAAPTDSPPRSAPGTTPPR
jgi:predicted ATPase/DNA-binding SARP family transcriptional activator